MKNKSIIAMALVAVLTSPSVAADELQKNGITIITDDFKVEDADDAGKAKLLSNTKKNNEIGTLGNKKVVSGKKNPEHIAYVKDVNEHNYIITNKLLVQCSKDIYCIPSGLDVQQISSNIYEITVDDYEEWSSIQEELSTTANVRNFSPSYVHGIDPSLK